MTKKTNRPKSKTSNKQAAKVEAVADQAESVAIPPVEPESRPTRTPKVTRSQIAAERIEDEYAYITGDLRRVFILAAAMFALLIILNIVLSQLGG
ncbi:MAG: hypothetical protein KBF17_12650 [Candidatus Promineofilum sp.]|mgnify:FL=1|nr:hypothetical protein [Promineifilum sp.]